MFGDKPPSEHWNAFKDVLHRRRTCRIITQQKRSDEAVTWIGNASSDVLAIQNRMLSISLVRETSAQTSWSATTTPHPGR
jgi:soluble P-type ATPase